jgi:hypothetical protein
MLLASNTVGHYEIYLAHRSLVPRGRVTVHGEEECQALTELLIINRMRGKVRHDEVFQSLYIKTSGGFRGFGDTSTYCDIGNHS